MDNKAIFNVFTKSVLQGLLDEFDGDYKKSWKKDKLIDLLCDFDLKTVLNKTSVKQLKLVLREMKLSETGRKSVLIDRIIGEKRGATTSPDTSSELQLKQEMKEAMITRTSIEFLLIFHEPPHGVTEVKYEHMKAILV